MQVSVSAKALRDAAFLVEFHTTQQGLEVFLNIVGKAFENGRAVNAGSLAAAVMLSYRPRS